MGKTEKSIYIFLKQKLRERKIKISDFYHQCGFSKATLYRIMKGLQKPTERQRDIISGLLNMNEAEKEMFLLCVNQLEMDEKKLAALEILRKSVFDEKSKKFPFSVEFITYGEERVIKSYQCILERIYRHIKEEGYSCSVKIFNCTREEFAEPLEKMLKLTEGLDVEIEHLLKIYDDYITDAAVVKAILPFIKHSKYNLYYQECRGVRAELFPNVVLFHLNNGEEDIFNVLIFGVDKYHSCYLTREMYEAFESKFNSVKRNYEPGLLVGKSAPNMPEDVHAFVGLSDISSKGNIDIYTKDDLENFVRTGTVLEKKEISKILGLIKERSNDPCDMYFYYLVDRRIKQGLKIINTFNGCIYIEYADSNKSYCIVQKSLSKIFEIFITKYIPEYVAVSKKEADEFIDKLIQMCEAK